MSKTYKCKLCDLVFKFQHGLTRHHKTKHDKYRLYCEQCGASTTTRSSLDRHIKSKHCAQEYASLKMVVIRCPLCSVFKYKSADLVEHYHKEHDITIENEDKEFSNEKEFQLWKKEVEKEQVCEFVCKNQYKRKTSDEKRVVYRCHRDGIFRSHSKAARHSKTSGTNKINGHCPAKMSVTHGASGRVKVSFCKTHVGHQGELGRLRLSKDERNDIASKIAMKIPFDEILDSVRNSARTDEVERLRLITRKDLHNIARDYKINVPVESKRIKGELTSARTLIRQRHRASLSLVRSTSVTFKADDNVWKVLSENRNDICEVRTSRQHCKCDLRCNKCKICIHAFSCTCPDSAIKSNMCKHIHLVNRTKILPKTESTKINITDDNFGELVIAEPLVILRTPESESSKLDETGLIARQSGLEALLNTEPETTVNRVVLKESKTEARLDELVNTELERTENQKVLNESKTETVKNTNREERKAQLQRKMMAILDEAESDEDFNIIEKHVDLIDASLAQKCTSTLKRELNSNHRRKMVFNKKPTKIVRLNTNEQEITDSFLSNK